MALSQNRLLWIICVLLISTSWEQGTALARFAQRWVGMLIQRYTHFPLSSGHGAKFLPMVATLLSTWFSIIWYLRRKTKLRKQFLWFLCCYRKGKKATFIFLPKANYIWTKRKRHTWFKKLSADSQQRYSTPKRWYRRTGNPPGYSNAWGRKCQSMSAGHYAYGKVPGKNTRLFGVHASRIQQMINRPFLNLKLREMAIWVWRGLSKCKLGFCMLGKVLQHLEVGYIFINTNRQVLRRWKSIVTWLLVFLCSLPFICYINVTREKKYKSQIIDNSECTYSKINA